MQNSNRTPKAPVTLSAEAKNLWRRLLSEYELNDSAALALLANALQAFDRMREAQALLARDGICPPDRFGQPRAHPAVLIERDSRAAMLKHLGALHLDVEPVLSPGRPVGS
ncbi:MAG: P27 family phage terminase small subunit [Phycisphaerae bacterium]